MLALLLPKIIQTFATTTTTTTTKVLIIVTLHKVTGALYISDFFEDGKQ